MASIRDQIVAAAIAELNTARPPGIPQADRTRLAAITPSELPSIIVFPGLDQPEEVGPPAGPIVRSRFRMIVEQRAAGTASVRPDAAVDALYVWVIKKLARKRLTAGGGGFLNHDTVEGETSFAFEQGDEPYALATTALIVTYQHLVADPEARV